MNPLDSILRVLRFDSAVFCRLEGGSPWGLSVPEVEGSPFHVVLILDGECHLHHDDGELTLHKGDVALMPTGRTQILADAPGRDATPLAQVAQMMVDSGRKSVALGPPPVKTVAVCGGFYFDQRLFGPLLGFVPTCLRLGRDDYEGTVMGSVLSAIANEVAEPRPASEVVLSRLGDVLFFEILRTSLATGNVSPDRANWARALAIPELARVLEAVHTDLGRRWSIDDLASVAGLSRSTFTARFREAVGMSPLEYLTHWRMAHAGSLLEDTALSLPEVAEAVGYASEVSFAKAFKSVVGTPPGRYRAEAPERRRPRGPPTTG